MFVRIHKTSNMPGIRNHKGSSAMLITYLEMLLYKVKEICS